MTLTTRENTDPQVLDENIRELRGLLAELQGVNRALVPADAHRRDQVEDAIRGARRTVRRAGRQGADFGAAEDLLAEAEAIKAKADAACQHAGG